jgi:hypothetical protein
MERKPFLLRIDPELWADLESWAQDELRSVNGQIEYILRQAVKARRGGTDAEGAARGAAFSATTRRAKPRR